jgi:hypothetical protein
MEEKIKSYFHRAQHHHIPKMRAQAILDLFTEDFSELCRPLSGGEDMQDLNHTLERFYTIKECKYLKCLLEHFVETENFDLPTDKCDTVYRLDRFRLIRNLLEEFLHYDNKVQLS